ncbi:hypothetical protein [Flagellimonas nanhaiensis]|uniref:Adhesin domain-containing protein n=1 Tax=Flagellimonas nanhaiensis TaxID=2292706 RepID=A0A371JT56_9FLAO|nr:hypothetical protein [Allomuricauda nanhaiensis]RDY61002.1 hypothetical protein DX873_02150 [Allomuricauda nanhaiensis]
MSRKHHILFNTFFFVLAGLVCYGQEKTKTKTYKETFNVGDEAVLAVNTSHADIEFETWDRDQVEITAVVELVGATDEEAESYFERDVVKIFGNSKEIEVKTSSGFGAFAPHVYDFNDLNIVIPDIPSMDFDIEIPEIPELPEIPEVFVIPELPPMPPMPFTEFDYDAYKKDGNRYLKKWKKDFDENFDEEYREELKEWSLHMKEMAKEKSDRIVEQRKLRVEQEELREEQEKLREEVRKEREELRAQREEVRQQIQEERKQMQEERRESRTTRSVRIHSGDDYNFYFSTDGEEKKYNVKKRIKIKMPKSVRLKMNVRHGEVKLAANIKNINASLSYSSLLASTIDGNRTNIRASYSPVVVQRWNYGQLKTDYSEKVSLKEVKDLKLSSVSSNVVIDQLEDSAYVTNSLGALKINSISDGFTVVDVSVKNGELDFTLPKVPFNIHVVETLSDLKYPSKLSLGTSKNHNTNIHDGYYINNKGEKSININSKYSEVVLKE